MLTGVTSDNPEISEDKITLSLSAREYIDNKNNSSLSFELYHFPEDSHLLPISSKVSRGTSLYVTGYLSIIGELLLVKITQINFIESTSSTTYKLSNHAWEKKQVNNPSSSTPSPADIAKSLSEKTKKRGKQKASPLSRPLKIPKLSNLSLSQQNVDDSSQNEPSSSFQLNANDDQNEFQTDNLEDEAEQEDEIIPKPKQGRGRRGRKKN